MIRDFEAKPNRVPVSVVIPCYRCAGTIERALESVMAQTVSPAEVRLVEDGSGDDGRTLATLYELQQRHSGEVAIEVIALGKNFGCAVARNAGLNASTQPYIAFLDADDAWHPRKLEIQYNWMRNHPDVFMTGHGWQWVRSDNPDLELSEDQGACHVSRWNQLLSNRFLTPTVMLRRDLSYRFVRKKLDSDGELWLRIVLDGRSAWRLSESLVYLYKAPFGQSGLSGNLWEVQKAVFGTYWRQVREGRLGLMIFVLLVPWLFLKHLRRLVITGVRGGGLLPEREKH